MAAELDIAAGRIAERLIVLYAFPIMVTAAQ